MKYYIVWVEGLEYKTGEKIKCFNNKGETVYTCRMMNAMRVKEKDIPLVKSMMKDAGVSDWVIDSPNTFIRTSYVPKTAIIFDSHSIF